MYDYLMDLEYPGTIVILHYSLYFSLSSLFFI